MRALLPSTVSLRVFLLQLAPIWLAIDVMCLALVSGIASGVVGGFTVLDGLAEVGLGLMREPVVVVA
jgi:hypothetical protein